MLKEGTRWVVDRAREPWMVEPASRVSEGTILRCRHDMGYELTVVASRPLEDLTDGELVRLLEEVRRRPPRVKLSSAA